MPATAGSASRVNGVKGHLFGQKKLYEALRREVPKDDMPSYSTVRRWVEGKAPIPHWAAVTIAAIAEFPADAEKEPPWVGRLQETVDSIHARQDKIMEGQTRTAKDATDRLTRALAPLERLEDVEWIADAIRRAQRPDAGDPHGSSASGAPGTAAPEGQGSA